MKSINDEIKKIEKNLKELANPKTKFLKMSIDGIDYNKNFVGTVWEAKLQTLQDVEKLIEAADKRIRERLKINRTGSYLIENETFKKEILGEE